MQREGVDLVAGARVEFGDQRVVTWNDAIGVPGQPLDGFPPRTHVADIVDDRKRAAAMEIAIEMRRIGRQHNRPPRSRDPHHLQSVGVTADVMHGDAGGDFALAGVKGDALAVDVAHHQRHMLDRKRMAQMAEAHASSGGVTHLAILNVKPGVRKQVEIACVIVMHMGDDDVLDVNGLNPKSRERLHRIAG